MRTCATYTPAADRTGGAVLQTGPSRRRPHSEALRARGQDRLGSIGWLLIFDDPDGLTLHLYTSAEHGIDVSSRTGYGSPITDPDGWQPN
jgi:hypothetical protein